MDDRKYLLKNLVLNHVTSCSIDEAVGMMLGLLKCPNWCFDAEYAEQLKNGEHDEDNKPFSLIDCLEGTRFYLQQVYYDAVDTYYDPEYVYADANELEAKLKEKLDDIENFDTNIMKKAKVYLCLIVDELAKGTTSKLRTIGVTPPIIDDSNVGEIRITLTSFDEWWATKKNETIEKSIFKAMCENVAETYISEPIRKGAKDVNTDVTFGMLLGALAALVPKNFIKEPTKNRLHPQPFDKDNFILIAELVSEKFMLDNLETVNIANFLHHLLVLNKISEKTPSQTADTIDDRLKIARDAALNYLNKQP